MSDDLRSAAREYLVRYGGAPFPNLFVSAKGSVVTDDSGREILDLSYCRILVTVWVRRRLEVAA